MLGRAEGLLGTRVPAIAKQLHRFYSQSWRLVIVSWGFVAGAPNARNSIDWWRVLDPARARCSCCGARRGSARPPCWATSQIAHQVVELPEWRVMSPRWSWPLPDYSSSVL